MKKIIKKAKKKTAIKSTKSKQPILKTGDLPVTQSMLNELRKQMKSENNSLAKSVEARFDKVDARFNQVEARFNQVEARFNQVDSRFNQVDSKIELVLSEIHRMAILVEEQNSRNKFVLDGYAQLYERQERIELRFDTHEKNIEKLILDLRKPL